MAKQVVRRAKTDKPTRAEKVAMALKLRTVLGLKAGDLAALIDENDGNLDALTIAERLRAFLRTRPRKT